MIHPTTLESLIKECREIQDFCDISCSGEIEEIVDRMLRLNTYHSRTCEMIMQAKHILRTSKSVEIYKQVIEVAGQLHLSAKVQNTLLDSLCADENRVVDWADRLNSTCSHQLDSLRSILSYEKESLHLNKTGY